jgi:multiple sugar transport system permease protein
MSEMQGIPLTPGIAVPKETQPISRRRTLWFPYALIAPTMITLTVVSLIPFLYTIYLTFHKMNYAQVGGFSGLANYKELLSNSAFWHSVWITTAFVAIAVPIEFALGLAGALLLHQKIRLRSAVVPLLFIPTMMAPVVVAILWKIMLAGAWGMLSYNVLERFGILGEVSAFASADLALYALVFVDIWEWTPFMTLAFFAGLQSLPLNPYRAAAVDGATPVQTFFRLTIPLMIPLMAVILLLRFIDAFKIFDTIFLLTAGGPGVATESVSIFTYKTVFNYWRMGTATVTAVIIWVLFFIFCNVFYQVAQKKLKAF